MQKHKMENSRSGFVAIAGLPNSGKSTLMNAILGAKISIVTDKPQTTRKKILGIYTEGNLQVIFIDTPGVLEPRYEMQKRMMGFVSESIDEADLLLIIADVSKMHSPEEYFPPYFIEKVKAFKGKKILALNKTDLIFQKNKLLPIISYFTASKIADEVVPISALNSDNTDALVKLIESHLPESPFFYDPEVLSTQPERFFVSEIIRENIFNLLHEEIPYSTEVQISEFKERETGKWYISADIILERDSQKRILIGKGGDVIKRIGVNSRAAIEEHLGMPVFLELFVKVRDNWRKNDTYLRSYGY